ncbi:hypothetical protein O1611_g4251 [Lasiodiplodia mahajangana]|uniref:Uncharacterized protein n=1 Tax=Lasiodiplodia mahajangana TaxID=1108764 RepID=A0ACC2JPE5_9PEZI|nr:hypothetical protein O1611_g4251 [Lasiodiplodia mahajangana]
MKAILASGLISLSLFTGALAFEVPWYDHMSLGDAQCKNYTLDGHIFHASCKDTEFQDSDYVDMSIDLNGCFANYDGNLNYVINGGYSSSCNPCHLNGTKLECECGIGGPKGGTKHNEVELNSWRTIMVTWPATGNPAMVCEDTTGIEKREARPFFA